MKSLTVRRGSANGNNDNSTTVTQRVGSLLGRLNGGMNYPTILPSFVCSYSSKTPPPHSKQCGSCLEHPPNHPASEHTETLTKLYQLMGQHSKKTITAHRHMGGSQNCRIQKNMDGESASMGIPHFTAHHCFSGQKDQR